MNQKVNHMNCKFLLPLHGLALGLLVFFSELSMADSKLLLDDFSSTDGRAALGTQWQGFTDRVMGGRSDLSAGYVDTDHGMALRMTGSVRLENNGGFIQLRLPLDAQGQAVDISNYKAVQMTVRGQPGAYYLHLRTEDNRRPWHYYSARFEVTPEWQTVRLPFSAFQAQGERSSLDLSRARSIAVVGYGERFEAEIEVAEIALVAGPVATEASVDSLGKNTADDR